MIIHMSKSSTQDQETAVLTRIKEKGFNYDVIHGSTGIDVIGILGDLSKVEENYFAELEGVDKVIRISKPYKLVSREFADQSKIISIGENVTVGEGTFSFMAGPCS